MGIQPLPTTPTSHSATPHLLLTSSSPISSSRSSLPSWPPSSSFESSRRRHAGVDRLPASISCCHYWHDDDRKFHTFDLLVFFDSSPLTTQLRKTNTMTRKTTRTSDCASSLSRGTSLPRNWLKPAFLSRAGSSAASFADATPHSRPQTNFCGCSASSAGSALVALLPRVTLLGGHDECLG